MSAFSRSLGWLYGALNLTEPAIPNNLDTAAVLPIIDATQGGIAVASDVIQVSDTQPASTGAVSRVILPADATLSYIVHAAQLWNGEAATNRTMGVWLRPYSGGGIYVWYGTTVPGANPILPLGSRWWVPPNTQVAWVPAVTGVGITHSLDLLYQTVRAGFKPF